MESEVIRMIGLIVLFVLLMVLVVAVLANVIAIIWPFLAIGFLTWCICDAIGRRL